METFSRLPRRLTQLYSDTKTSCDAVVEQTTPETLPEDHALHRKYRIQKDRLITWGLEWGDTKGKAEEDIDESVERAGLTETVTSVLGTIKDILDEAERMQPPARHAGQKSLSGEKASGRSYYPPAWAASDRSRYEVLANELTTSIDILYDLSRSRRSAQGNAISASTKAAPEPQKPTAATSVFLSSEYNASDVTLINPATLPVFSNVPARSSVPPKLDPNDLVLPQEEPPPYESVGDPCTIRVIGKLRSRHSSTNPWKTDGSKCIETPVLVEFAAFDPTYRFTGVTPSLDRLDTLFTILSRLSSEQSYHGTLNCLGYFEDPRHPRFGIVFELPSSVYSGVSDGHKTTEELQPVTLLSVLQTGSKSQHNSNSATPPLEDRFRLAFTLTSAFNKIHGDEFVHKDVNSSNILVFRKSKRQSHNSRALQYSLRSPVICSFDLFSDCDIDPSTKMAPNSVNIYRHPEDPKSTSQKGKEHGPQFDLYSLGLVLLEIGLWVPLSDLFKPKYTLADFKQRVEDVYIRRLASKCGTAYMQVVRDCFWAADRIASGAESLQNISYLYNRILIRLQRCCLLDEVDPGFNYSELTTKAAPTVSSPPLKRKSVTSAQATDVSQSPTHRSAKRWALDKGSLYLERTRSLSKSLADVTSSPKAASTSSLSRSGSQKSMHSIRKSISQNMPSLKVPVQEQYQPMEWEAERGVGHVDSLERSGTLVASKPITPTFPAEREQIRHAARVIQRAWRASRAVAKPAPQRSFSLRDYKEKITVIQNAWRQRKGGTNTVGALIANANAQVIGYATSRGLGYPTPEPDTPHSDICDTQSVDPISSPHVESIHTMQQREQVQQQQPEKKAQLRTDVMASSIQIETDVAPPTVPRTIGVHEIQFSEELLKEWETTLSRLEKLIGRTLKDPEETVSINLLVLGETKEQARPTIIVTCDSTTLAKATLKRKFKYNKALFDLRVHKGGVQRSKMNRSSRRRQPAHRSMMNTSNHADVQVMNPFYQQRPVCGASIGAFRDEHLPPVSYGGVVLVDDEPLGLSVHHLLDAPSEDEESDYGDDDISPSPYDAVWSSARGGTNPWLMGMGSQPGVQIASDANAPMWHLEISDEEDVENAGGESYDFSSESEYDSGEESEADLAGSITSHMTAGDIVGIPKGEGETIKITQPAIDDVHDDFFPNEEDKDEDHLDSHELGYVHASSGIRRWNRGGIVHEIDWALLKLNEDRLQPYNLVQGGRQYCINRATEPDQRVIASKLAQPVQRNHYAQEDDEYPNEVASADNLGGLSVHCFGRTTGLQGGMVGSAMSSVRIYRRKTFSRSWHVQGNFGVGGDSGAWVIQNGTHRVVGHVLAWCERNRIAYICPMQVLLEDIKRTLGAKRIYLPGSVEEARHLSRTRALSHKADSRVHEVEIGVGGLSIIDSAVDVNHAAIGSPSRRNRLELPPLNTSSESDKENRPVLRSRLIKVQEARSPVGMVGVP